MHCLISLHLTIPPGAKHWEFGHPFRIYLLYAYSLSGIKPDTQLQGRHL